MTAIEIVILAVVVLVCYYPAKWLLFIFKCSLSVLSRLWQEEQW